MKNKKAVVLINVGTPDSPSGKDVRRFLKEFLNDKHVIDLPYLARKILVNAIIIPFRTKKSSALYKRLWTNEGSPIVIYTRSLCKKLQTVLGNEADVYMAMRYQSPSMTDVFKQIAQHRYNEVIAIPMYPQYAGSTTGTTIEYGHAVANRIQNFPPLRFVEQFYHHPGFIHSMVQQASKFNISSYDHIVFSYHGLPVRQVQKTHPGLPVSGCACQHGMPEHGKSCYRATCYETSRLLIQALKIDSAETTTSFQSRLSRNWLEPFSDEVISRLAHEGKKKVLVFAPAFVTDCLETLIEIEQDYRELFQLEGGKVLDMVPGLNDSVSWAETLASIVKTIKKDEQA